MKLWHRYGYCKYTVLLASLLGLLVLHPFLRERMSVQVFRDLLFTLVFVSGILALSERHRHRIALSTTGVVAVAGSWYIFFRPEVSTGFYIFIQLAAVFFLGAAAVVIITTILGRESVALDSLAGAFCGYLLIGLCWTSLYAAIESAWPGSFDCHDRLREELDNPLTRYSLLAYYSLCTLTTVGYGDVTPVSPQARTLAWIEAMTGQFYIAAFVAGLVGMRVTEAFHRRSLRSQAAEKKS